MYRAVKILEEKQINLEFISEMHVSQIESISFMISLMCTSVCYLGKKNTICYLQVVVQDRNP
jgi:hypothetical protein